MRCHVAGLELRGRLAFRGEGRSWEGSGEMAFLNNHTLALDALAPAGCVMPTEYRAAIDTSLVIKKEEAGLRYLGFWGRVLTQAGRDYLLAQGCNAIDTAPGAVVPDIKYYYSLDGARWLDLQPLSDEAYNICRTIQGGFKGDPSHKYTAYVKVAPTSPAAAPGSAKPGGDATANPDAPKVEEIQDDKPAEAEVTTDNAEGGDEEEGEGEEENVKKRKKKRDPNLKAVDFGELDRLSALMRSVDAECGVMPLGAFILDYQKQLVPNTFFPGVKFPEKLDSYGHIFQQYEDSMLTKDITGSWSVRLTPITNDVILRSLQWPGYYFYYSPFTKAYGSLYFGLGDKNWDFGFMVG